MIIFCFFKQNCLRYFRVLVYCSSFLLLLVCWSLMNFHLQITLIVSDVPVELERVASPIPS